MSKPKGSKKPKSNGKDVKKDGKFPPTKGSGY